MIFYDYLWKNPNKFGIGVQVESTCGKMVRCFHGSEILLWLKSLKSFIISHRNIKCKILLLFPHYKEMLQNTSALPPANTPQMKWRYLNTTWPSPCPHQWMNVKAENIGHRHPSHYEIQANWSFQATETRKPTQW